VRIALAQSADVKRAANDLTLGRASVAEARFRFVPDLRLGVSGSESFGRSFVEEEGRIVTQSNESVNARLSSSVTLFDGLANVADLEAARLEATAAGLELERTRQTVVFDVISRYLALIEAREQVSVLDEDLAAQLEQEEQVRRFVDAGERPISELYQQQASTARARLSLVEARQTRALREVDLVQTLQLDPVAEYVFEAPPLPEVEPPLPEPGQGAAGSESTALAALLEVAFASRPDLSAQTAQVAAATAGRRAASGGWWPSVGLSGSFGSNYSSTRPDDVLSQFEDRWSASLGLSVSMPIFDRLATHRAVQRARIAEDNARITEALGRHAVALEVRRAVLERDAAHERLDAADAQVRAAQAALDAVQQRYGVGAATIVEVSLARAELTGAGSSRVTARYDVVWQERLLDYYLGLLATDAPLVP
jgi:outer membrane protein